MTLRTHIDKLLPRLATWVDTWGVRAPAVAMLRLHEVLAWVVGSNACAIGCAPLAVGHDTRAIGDPTAYMLLWLVLSSMFALRWAYLQWIDRPSLPRQLALPWQWSSGVSSLIVMAMMSVVIVSGRAAQEEIRTLRSTAELRDDLSRLEAFVQHRTWYSALADESVAAWARASKGDAIPWDTLGVYVPDRLLQGARTCSGSFFTSNSYRSHRKPCDSLANRTSTLGAADAENLWNCLQKVQGACGFHELHEALGDNLMRLVMAHHLYTCEAGSLEAWLVLQTICLSLLLGCLTSFAGVNSFRIPSAMVLLLAFLGLLAGPALYTHGVALDSGPGRSWLELPEILGGVIFGALLVWLAIAMLMRRPRSAVLDGVMALLFLWPLLIVAQRSIWAVTRIDALTYVGMWATCSPDPHPGPVPYIVAGCACLLGFALLRYRTRPHSR